MARAHVATVSRPDKGVMSSSELDDLISMFENEGWRNIALNVVLLDPVGVEYEVLADEDSNPYRRAETEA